jgi:hypothetical protein
LADPITGATPQRSASGIGSYQTPEDPPPFGVGPDGQVHVRSTPNPVLIDPPYSPPPWEGVGPGDRGAGPSGPTPGGGGAVSLQQTPQPPTLEATGTEEAAAPPETPPIISGLGEEVDAIINQSPSLKRLWEQAQKNGWRIELDTSQKSWASKDNSTIYINPNDVQSQGAARPGALASLLSHELGHAGTPFPPDVPGRTREEFVDRNVQQALLHEGAAALTNLEARAEILARGGPDIGVRGGLDEFYLDVFSRYQQGPPQGLTRDQAIQLLGQFMGAEPEMKNGANKQEVFEILYGQVWDEAHSND